jgi:CubicO group peptidase (beta-lactamase class C family)
MLTATSMLRAAAALAAVAVLAAGCSSGDDDAADRAAPDPTAAAPAPTPTTAPTTTSGGSSTTGATGGTGAADRAVFPGDEWARVDPAAAGFDPAKLDAIAADAQAAGSNCLAVVRHGELVAEWNWNGTDQATSQDVFSATKSLTSTLVGIAQGDGDLAVTDPAAAQIPAWQGTPADQVTIADLLSNDSGRHWDVVSDYLGLVSAKDRDTYAASLAQDDPPGATWVYNNAAIQNLDAVLRGATGQPTDQFATERLLEPIGMAHSSMSTDQAGGTATFTGLHTTCEDLARFGYLFLRGGEWDGTQVVPADWVAEATGRPSTDLNAAYGYLWWINREGPVLSDPLVATSAAEAAQMAPSRLVPGVPDDMYWALGLGGQVVQVDPGSDTVVVRLGPPSLSTRTGPGNTGSYGPSDTARVVTEALVDRPAGTLPG